MNGDELYFSAAGLGYRYGRGTRWETPALAGVSMQVKRGEMVGLIGPTGSGKSTLLQHLCGLVRPQTGTVVVNGLDLSEPDLDLRVVRRSVGMVFQQPEDQLFERYVGDDVAFGPRNAGLARAEVRERVTQAMNAVNLPFDAFKDRLTLTLSGGERRRAAIAGVLGMQPEALLLDEPTAGLDPAGREELLSLVEAWHAERNLTVVVSSHNMDDVARLASQVFVLDRGRIAFEGATRDVFRQAERLGALGLEPPAATRILRALEPAGLRIEEPALTVEEAADLIVAALSEVPSVQQEASRG